MTDRAIKTSPLGVVKRYAILAYGAVGTMLDVGLMVLGTLLIGLAASVLLVGLEIIDAAQELSTAAMLVSTLVLAVTGMFCLGLASEGPLGRGYRLVGYKEWEIAIARGLAVLGVGFGALALYGALLGFLADLPEPIQRGADGIQAVGLGGLTAMPVLGVPLAFAARLAKGRFQWVRRADIPVMFVVWAVAAMVFLG
ncbi:MAG: hypothetical protein ACE5F5_09700 [Acidimicrobiia bacterium]